MKLIVDWLNDKSHGQWLMILDNADDRSVFFPTVDADTSYEISTESYLADYIPSSSVDHGSLVITTRNSELGTDLADGDDPIAVPHFTPEEAKKLLESKVEPKYWDIAAADTLLNVLDYIPLAITQASAYMNKKRLHMKRYLKALSESDSNLAAYLTTELLDPRRLRGTPSSIFLTWKLSFDQISEEEPRAAEILSLMAFLDRQGIPERLLRRGEDLDVKDTNAIGTLQAYSLITAERDDETYSMHRLVQLSTQTWLRLQGKKDMWEANALELLSGEFPPGDHENRNECNTLLPHAIAVLNYIPASDSAPISNSYQLHRASLLYNLGWFNWTQGRYKDAILYCEESNSIRQKILGLDDLSTLSSSDMLATTYRDQGRWKEAEVLGEQVIETRKRVLGAEHSHTLASMGNLASTYWNQGRLKEAEDLEEQVMETRKRVLGAEHPHTLQSMANLATTYADQGRWKEAEVLEVQVVETRKRVLGAEHPDTLTSMSNLALTYNDQGRWKEAEDLGVQVIETRKRVLGAEHPNTLVSMANLALTYADQGRLKEAEDLEEQVMETSQRVLGTEHPHTLSSIANLAHIFYKKGRKEQAIQLMEGAVKSSEAIIGADHPDTLNRVKSLQAWTWETH